MTKTVQDISVPSLGESITQATLACLAHKEGDSVAADALLAEIETDKITLEVNAPFNGIVEKVHVDEGATVHVGDVLFTLRSELLPQNKTDANKDDAPKAASTDSSREDNLHTSQEKTPLSPKNSFQQSSSDEWPEKNKEASGETSPSLKSAVVSKEEYLRMLAEPHTADQENVSLSSSPLPSLEKAPLHSPLKEERVPMSRLRKRIAEQLKSAQNTAALLTTFNEVNMEAVMDVRSHNKDAFEAHYGCRLGFMSFFVKAVVKALRQFPIINAELSGDDILFKNYYHIGVAVGTQRGLVVPTLKHAEKMSLATIEKNIAHLAQKAREKQLLPHDLADGTFTISNGGVYGSLLSTPIINPPQSAILGLHSIQKRPIADGDKIVIKPMMYVALSYDHRIIDGKDAVGFLKCVKETIENPGGLLLDL